MTTIELQQGIEMVATTIRLHTTRNWEEQNNKATARSWDHNNNMGATRSSEDDNNTRTTWCCENENNKVTTRSCKDNNNKATTRSWEDGDNTVTITLCHLLSVRSRNQITSQTESIHYSLVNVAQLKQKHDAEVQHYN